MWDIYVTDGYAELALQLQLSLPVFSTFVVLWGMIIFFIGKQIRVSNVIDKQQKFAYPQNKSIVPWRGYT